MEPFKNRLNENWTILEQILLLLSPTVNRLLVSPRGHSYKTIQETLIAWMHAPKSMHAERNGHFSILLLEATHQ